MAGYNRSFCLDFSEIVAPLTDLLSKKVKFVWTDDCQLVFNKVKLLLQKSPVLKCPDYKKPFKLIIDSSDVGTGSFRWIRSPCQLFFKEILKISKELFSGRKKNIGPSFSLGTF